MLSVASMVYVGGKTDFKTMNLLLTTLIKFTIKSMQSGILRIIAKFQYFEVFIKK
jgi:hypothetical protein